MLSHQSYIWPFSGAGKAVMFVTLLLYMHDAHEGMNVICTGYSSSGDLFISSTQTQESFGKGGVIKCQTLEQRRLEMLPTGSNTVYM